MQIKAKGKIWLRKLFLMNSYFTIFARFTIFVALFQGPTFSHSFSLPPSSFLPSFACFLSSLEQQSLPPADVYENRSKFSLENIRRLPLRRIGVKIKELLSLTQKFPARPSVLSTNSLANSHEISAIVLCSKQQLCRSITTYIVVVFCCESVL